MSRNSYVRLLSLMDDNENMGLEVNRPEFSICVS